MTSDLNAEICARDKAMIDAFDRRVRVDAREYRVDTPTPMEASTIADLTKRLAALEAAVAELKRGADVPPPPKHSPGMSPIPDIAWGDSKDAPRRSIEQVRAEAKAKADQRWKTGLGGSK